jgi:hypothetical protein
MCVPPHRLPKRDHPRIGSTTTPSPDHHVSCRPQSGAYTQSPNPSKRNPGDKPTRPPGAPIRIETPHVLQPERESLAVPTYQAARTRPSDRYTIWLTTTIGQAGHTDHAVRHAELATRSGSYTAVCGSLVHPASMMTPPGPQCVRCVTYFETTAPHSQPRTAAGRHKPSRFRRILAMVVPSWRRNTSGDTGT